MNLQDDASTHKNVSGAPVETWEGTLADHAIVLYSAHYSSVEDPGHKSGCPAGLQT